MVPRIAAMALGVIAAVAAVLILALDWNSAVALVGVNKPAILSTLADPVPRLAWIVSSALAIFASVALLIALVAGFAEVLVARARIDALRHDPALAGRWNPADWRAAFAHTAVRERAEAIVAALLPTSSATLDTPDRRAIADMSLLVDLDKVWLERLALDGPIGPLPNLLLGIGGALALVRYASGEPGWEIVLAAGVGAWLVIRGLHYIVRLILGPAVALAVGAATAAVRPLTSVLSLELIARRTDDRPYMLEPMAPEATVLAPGAADPQLIARMSEAADRLNNAGNALVGQLAGQLSELASRAGQAGAEAAAAPLAAIADGLRGAVQQREQAIESAMAEVRSGIEALLSAPPPAVGGTTEAADAIRGALAEQAEALRQAGAEFRGGLEGVTGSLQATLGSIEATERRNADTLSELLRAIDALAASRAEPPAPTADPAAPGPESNVEIADALRNLLRDFDES